MKTKLEQNQIAHPQIEAIPAPLEVHPSVSPKAAELLERVIEILMITPEKYNQQIPCGSACCIIGHMKHLGGDCGPEDLGLTVSQYHSIFLIGDWPDQFVAPAMARWHDAKEKGGITTRITAQEGIARIEHFLHTGN